MHFKYQLISLYTILYKEIRRIFRIWIQTLLQPAVTSLLYFVILGHVIGSRIGAINGFRYVQFIAPGLIMMSVITNSYTGSVSSFFSSKFQRSIEELLVSPTPNYIILLGYMLSGIARGAIVAVIVTAIALFFTHLHIYSLFAVICSASFASAIFSLMGIINAIYAKKFDDIAIIPTFILTPLAYLGGVFYSIKMLTPFWQYVSLVNPIVYIIGNFRYGFLGASDAHLVTAYLMMFLLTLVAFIFTWVLLNKGVGMRE